MFTANAGRFPSQSATTRSRSLPDRRLAGVAGSLVPAWRRHQAPQTCCKLGTDLHREPPGAA